MFREGALLVLSYWGYIKRLWPFLLQLGWFGKDPLNHPIIGSFSKYLVYCISMYIHVQMGEHYTLSLSGSSLRNRSGEIAYPCLWLWLLQGVPKHWIHFVFCHFLEFWSTYRGTSDLFFNSPGNWHLSFRNWHFATTQSPKNNFGVTGSNFDLNYLSNF